MAAKKKAAKAGAGAMSAGAAARENQYVQRLIEDRELRENLRTAYESARKAYDRMNGKGPSKALDDKKVQRDLKRTAVSLSGAVQGLRATPKKQKKKKRRGRLLLVAIVGAGVAVGVNEGLRKKVLAALFGAEEEFEYSSTTTPEATPGWEPAAKT